MRGLRHPETSRSGGYDARVDQSRDEEPQLSRRQGMRMVDLSSIGLVFPVAMILGYLMGGAVGGWFGAREIGQWIGGVIGIVSGFYNVYKVVLRLNAETRAEEEEARRGGTNDRSGRG